MLVPTLMNLGMLLVTAGAIPSMIAVLKNRNELKDFSILGLIGAIAANTSFMLAQILLRIWLSAALNAVMITHGLIVLLFVWKCQHVEEYDPLDCSDPRGSVYPDCHNGPSPLCKHCSKDSICGEIMREKDAAE